MIGQILRFSRLTAGPMAEPASALDLAEILEETTEDARLEGAARRLEIRLTCDGPAFVLGERETLRSALENVMRNGVRHAPAGSTRTCDYCAEPRNSASRSAMPGQAWRRPTSSGCSSRSSAPAPAMASG